MSEDLFKINQLDYTDSYGKYDINNITGKMSYDKYTLDKKNSQKIQRSSNGNSNDKYKLNSLVLQPDTQSILLSSDSILNFINKKTISDRLKLNNAYIIHGLEYKYVDYRKRPDNSTLVTPLEQKEILFIDNYCNYHIIRNNISTEDNNESLTITNSDVFTVIDNKEIRHFKLPDQMIDIIKNLNGCQILGFNYSINNVYNFLDGIGNYISKYYKIQNTKLDIQQSTTNQLTTQVETHTETITDLNVKLDNHLKIIEDLTNKLSEHSNLINTLQDTITNLNNEKDKIQEMSDKYREEIKQFKFNNILYIEKIEE
jgi:hypothetical protein